MDMSGHGHGAGHGGHVHGHAGSGQWAPRSRMGPGVADDPRRCPWIVPANLALRPRKAQVTGCSFTRDLVALERNTNTRGRRHAQLEIRLTPQRGTLQLGVRRLEVTARAPPPYSGSAPDERVRITLVNDTMMTHPIHLPRALLRSRACARPWGTCRASTRSTSLPGGKVSYDVTAEEGDWAFHCHMLVSHARRHVPGLQGPRRGRRRDMKRIAIVALL